MDRRQALRKATIDTTVAAGGLLAPEQSKAFIRAIKDKSSLLAAMRTVRRRSPSGVIDKLSTGSRIIRRATENADDGYRAGAAFDSVPYETVKIRLPWEVTEDVFQENIEGSQLEADLTDEFTTQFSLDLEDLSVNGDTAAVGPDAAFLNIDDGLLVQMAASGTVHRIDGSTINAGVIDKAHFFEGFYAMPNKYRSSLGSMNWIMSPNRAVSWWESLTDRAGAAGDALLASRDKEDQARGPLNVPILEVASWPDDRIVLANPKNFVEVITWDVRKRKVTGETDAELAAKDKRFYVFFVKRDTIIEEEDAVVDIHTLDPVA